MHYSHAQRGAAGPHSFSMVRVYPVCAYRSQLRRAIHLFNHFSLQRRQCLCPDRLSPGGAESNLLHLLFSAHSLLFHLLVKFDMYQLRLPPQEGLVCHMNCSLQVYDIPANLQQLIKDNSAAKSRTLARFSRRAADR